MQTRVIKELADHDVHFYGSDEQLKFEKHMERYFTREYDLWRGNKETPESYGVSSFEGDVAKKATHENHIDPYNKKIDIYKAFLDRKYMAYTMAYYGATDESPVVTNNLTLEQAQENKYRMIIERAGLVDGQNILDLGCGFGGFIKYLLQTFPNITVTGINPSQTQTDLLYKTLEGHESKYKIIHKYVGDTGEEVPSNSFDRVVSIGVLEHFSNLNVLFKYLRRVLKPGGKCLHHLIVSKDTIPQLLKAENTLIADYFPDGHIWPYAEPSRHNTYLSFVDSWFINGMNYWKTLDEWHRRFWWDIDNLYPAHLTAEEVEDWNKYFTLCKTMFSPNKGKSYGNAQYLYVKD